MNGAWLPCYLALVSGIGIGFWLRDLLDEKPVQAPPLPDALPMPGFDADLRTESAALESYETYKPRYQREIEEMLRDGGRA